MPHPDVPPSAAHGGSHVTIGRRNSTAARTPMAQITSFLFSRHLRSDPSHHVLHYRHGRLVKSGRGVAYWFMPLAASIAEVPCDDRELAFLFHARTADFQDVTTQGVITYRVAAPEKVAQRIDFAIDLGRGTWKQNPLEQIGNLLSQLAQQFAWDYVAHTPVRAVLAEGMLHAGEKIRAGFAANEQLPAMGLEIVAVRVTGVAPTADVEKALQTPTREGSKSGVLHKLSKLWLKSFSPG